MKYKIIERGFFQKGDIFCDGEGLVLYGEFINVQYSNRTNTFQINNKRRDALAFVSGEEIRPFLRNNIFRKTTE